MARSMARKGLGQARSGAGESGWRIMAPGLSERDQVGAAAGTVGRGVALAELLLIIPG